MTDAMLRDFCANMPEYANRTPPTEADLCRDLYSDDRSKPSARRFGPPGTMRRYRGFRSAIETAFEKANQRLGDLYGHLDGAGLPAQFTMMGLEQVSAEPAPKQPLRLYACTGSADPAGVRSRTLAEVDADAMEAKQARRDRVPHPLTPLVRYWFSRPKPFKDRDLLTTVERKERPDRLVLLRQPALAGVTLTAWQVDGVPVATEQPDMLKRKYRQAPRPEQAGLWPMPAKLGQAETGGALIEAVSRLPLDGDQRSPLRADVLRVATVAAALSGAVILTDAEAAELVAGADTPANRKRADRALEVARYLRIRLPGYTFPFDLVDAETGGDVARLGPPRWWSQGNGPKRHTLTGTAIRPATKWGIVERTVAGLESALNYGRAAGKGKHGRTPHNLRPVRPGGPALTCSWNGGECWP